MSSNYDDLSSGWDVELDGSEHTSTSSVGAPLALLGLTIAALAISIGLLALGAHWVSYIAAVVTTLGCIMVTYVDRARQGPNYAQTISVDLWVKSIRALASISAVVAVIQIAIEAAK